MGGSIECETIDLGGDEGWALLYILACLLCSTDLCALAFKFSRVSGCRALVWLVF